MSVFVVMGKAVGKTEDRRAQLRAKSMCLPLLPGVYIMKNTAGEIIYIGKAKALKNRVSQYFGSPKAHTVKVRKMVENVQDFDYIVTDSEFEALVLECSLIKQHMPKYNILLKDDKGYSYIRVAGEKFKTISAVLQKQDDGAQYIGPYTSSYAVKQSVDAANKIFMLPQCGKDFDKGFQKTRPCLNYYISRCCGVCTGKVNQKEYADAAEQAIRFLKGDSGAVIQMLTKQMEEASERLDFERAARLRDRIQAIRKLQEKQKVVFKSVEEQDVFSMAESENNVCLAVLRFADGRLFDSEHFFFEKEESAAETMTSAITSYYTMRHNIPRRVTVDGEVEGKEDLERWLCAQRGKKTMIFCPQRGEQVEVVKMCRENAQEKLALKLGMRGRDIAILEELRDILGLKSAPAYIEAYDISHTAGQDSVGGMIVFCDGKPLKSAYRRFIIKSFEGNDDYRSMHEVLTRRFNEYEKHKNSGEGFGRLPDLILLDGGAGQVSAVQPVLDRFGLHVPLFGMVKDNRPRTRAIALNGGEIEIRSNRRVFTLISDIQEEVHRYSVAYHHNRHAKRTLSMSLCEIDGIGEKKARALLRRFKTLTAIRNADIDALCTADGISRKTAEKIYAFYHGKEDENA